MLTKFGEILLDFAEFCRFKLSRNSVQYILVITYSILRKGHNWGNRSHEKELAATPDDKSCAGGSIWSAVHVAKRKVNVAAGPSSRKCVRRCFGGIRNDNARSIFADIDGICPFRGRDAFKSLNCRRKIKTNSLSRAKAVSWFSRGCFGEPKKKARSDRSASVTASTYTTSDVI